MSAAERQARHRAKRQAEIAALPSVACACGCGTLIPPINKKGLPARFAHGHNPDGEATRFTSGQTAWNRGLPAPWAIRTHTGKRLSAEEVERRTATRRERGNYVAWNKGKPHSTSRQGAQTSGVGGVRADLGHYLRSRWEANYARYLRYSGTPYSYEPGVFIVRLPDGEEHAYRPDFLVNERYYVEIKGFLDRTERPTRAILCAAQEQLPLPLIVLYRAEYEALQRLYARLIPTWEYVGSPRPQPDGRTCETCGRDISGTPRGQRFCSRACIQRGGWTMPKGALARSWATRRARKDEA